MTSERHPDGVGRFGLQDHGPHDDLVEPMTLAVDMTQADDGLLKATITSEQIAALTGRYTTWQLFESPSTTTPCCRAVL